MTFNESHQEPPASDKTQPPLYMKSLQWAFLILGCVTLIIQYLSQRSFWLDESNLALNIRSRSLLELFQPLDNFQSAPVGFLTATKLVTMILGYNDFALRLIPLLCGLITLMLLVWVSQKISPISTPLAVAMVATCLFYIYYATEFKQYAVDATLTLLYLGLIIQTVQAPTRKNIGILALIGMVSVWFSHPMIFVLAGMGLVLWLHFTLKRDWIRVRHLMVMGVLQLMSFALVYWISYRQATIGSEIGDFMNKTWQAHFLRLNINSFMQFFFEIFTLISGFYNPVLFILCLYGFVIGIVRIRKLWLWLILSPLLFTGMASFVELYPLANRFLLFILAPIIIIIAIGWIDMVEKIRQKQPIISGVIVAVLCTLLMIRIEVPMLSDIRPALELIDQYILPDEDIYVTGRMSRTAEHYGYDYILFPAPFPTDKRIWFLGEARLIDFEGVELPYPYYISYKYVWIWLSCVPTADRPCPTLDD